MTEVLYSPETIDYGEVAEADPLSLDDRLLTLPLKNAAANTEALQADLEFAVDTLDEASMSALSLVDSYAALRDIDFLAASLVRHGVDPITSIPGLETRLLQLSERTGTIPRGTVYTYAGFNPEGERQRSFTGSAEENLFITAVRQSVFTLDEATFSLSAITRQSSGQTIGDSLAYANAACDEMTTAIVAVHRGIPPHYFTNELRPYFDPLVIGGQAYTGAGGAQLQLLAIDHMLWGIEEHDPAYRTFYEENYPYLSPEQREALQSFVENNDGQSLVTRVLDSKNPELAKQLATTVRKIRRFRYPHKRVADDNFKLRPENAVGSGSYRPDILGRLIMLTEARLHTLDQSL